MTNPPPADVGERSPLFLLAVIRSAKLYGGTLE